MAPDSIIPALIEQEYQRQVQELELIASENFVSQPVLAAAGSVLTNKYAEGYPGKRYYGGCAVVDAIEQLAIERARQLFTAAWVNVQPHSGSQANAAVLLALLQPGDKLLGFSLAHGGHLTHGASVNFSGKLYQAAFYGVSPTTGYIDWDEVEQKAHQEKPKLIFCGASAYSRDWDYARLRTIADAVGAWLVADIAHPAGLIAGGLLNNPLPHCHVVTTTTHKTLRGPRGGMLLMGQDSDNPWGLLTPQKTPIPMSTWFDRSVFPGTQGGPLVHLIAAKAIAFQEALGASYTQYVQQVQKNARRMAQGLSKKGYQIVSGGTDNHVVLVDLRPQRLTGKQAEIALGKAAITVNKNMVPFDDQSPWVTSGIRLGTAAITTRGLLVSDIDQVVELIDTVLKHPDQDRILDQVKAKVHAWMSTFPLTTQDTEGSTPYPP